MGKHCQVGKEASVFLSAVLEHITGAMLKEASGESRSEQSTSGLYTRIGPKHIKATLSKNGDLKQLASTVASSRSGDKDSVEEDDEDNSSLSLSQSTFAFVQHSPPPSPRLSTLTPPSELTTGLRSSSLKEWCGVLTCIGLEGSGSKPLLEALSSSSPSSTLSTVAIAFEPNTSPSLQALSLRDPKHFSFTYQVHLATACVACRTKARSMRKSDSSMIATMLCSPLECFANATYEFSLGNINKQEFKAYRQLHEDLWPPIHKTTTATAKTQRGVQQQQCDITILVDAAPAAIIASRNVAKEDGPTFVELERRNGILFEAMITRIATHRDVLVVDRWYARFPLRVVRRLEAVVNGDVALPAVSLVENFRGLASLNEPILESPWRSTASPVVYQSAVDVAQAFEDLVQGKWEEAWFDEKGKIAHVQVEKAADVYVHVGFWSPTWRTNQLMRVLSRHLSRGQNIQFFTPPAKSTKEAESYGGHPLVRWLSSLTKMTKKSNENKNNGDDGNGGNGGNDGDGSNSTANSISATKAGTGTTRKREEEVAKMESTKRLKSL